MTRGCIYKRILVISQISITPFQSLCKSNSHLVSGPHPVSSFACTLVPVLSKSCALSITLMLHIPIPFFTFLLLWLIHFYLSLCSGYEVVQKDSVSDHAFDSLKTPLDRGMFSYLHFWITAEINCRPCVCYNVSDITQEHNTLDHHLRSHV